MIRSLCVFCGSSAGTRPAYREAAAAVGRLLAAQGTTLVYGGGKVGLMGTVADACLAGGGRVIGVIPRALVDLELAHGGLSELRVVGSMHERKASMADSADAFLALPGGIGTFEEFFEVLTWSQLGLQRKGCALLNVEGYYAPLLGLIDHAVAEGFLKQKNRELLLTGDEPGELLKRLAALRPHAVQSGIGPKDR